MDGTPPLEPGTELAGKYRIERVLARGGMGVIVCAQHLRLDERVAIKFLLADALNRHPDAVARFEQEARAAAKIKSEHVARVSDIGTLEWGAPYMVMEYLEGQDLAQLAHQRGALPVAEAVDYLLQACEALAEAHALGIVHRDLKPANLFVTRRADGSVCIKVLDFGISKITRAISEHSSDYGMTQPAVILGSPYYMSPEQLTSSRDVDMRTDVWALGVMLYELVTGRKPFDADTLPQLSITIATQPATPLRQLRPELPEGLESTITACLQKSRDDRLSSVAEFAIRISSFAPPSAQLSLQRILRVSENAGLSSNPPPLSQTTYQLADDGHHRTIGNFSRTGTRHSFRAWWVAASVAVLMIGAAVGAWLLWQRSPAGASAAAGSLSVEPPPLASHVSAVLPSPPPPPPPEEPAVPQVEPPPLATVGSTPDAPLPQAHVARPTAPRVQGAARPRSGASAATPSVARPAAQPRETGSPLGGRL
ncbi:MAG: serine/threonine-protein kinase [Polyangiaceae bacterium]